MNIKVKIFFVLLSALSGIFAPGYLLNNSDQALADESEKQPEKMCKDLCGDGSCQEIVCMAEGCPCPETAQSCPKDCSK